MLKDEPADGHDEQRHLSGIQRIKKSLWPLEEKAGNSGRLEGCHKVTQGEN